MSPPSSTWSAPTRTKLFTVVVWGEDRPRFDRAPEERFRDRRVCVTGKITSYKGTPQIVVRRPDQIEIAEAAGGP